MALKTPHLKFLTVTVLNGDTEEFVGNGFVVGRQGIVATCAHVVRDAGIDPATGRTFSKKGKWWRRYDLQKEGIVYLRYPWQDVKKPAKLLAASNPPYEDDVVLLAPDVESNFWNLNLYANLGSPENSTGNKFKTFLWPPEYNLPEQFARAANSEIVGLVPVLGRKRLRCPSRVQLKGIKVKKGQSGSAVLDIERDLIVGMLSDAPNEDDMPDVGWAVDSRVLGFPPFSGALTSHEFVPREHPHPETDMAKARSSASNAIRGAHFGVPPLEPRWSGRETLLRSINDDWHSPNVKITALVGFGGEGKSSLARRWLDQINAQVEHAPHSTFWWDFYENRSAEVFFSEAIEFFSGHDPSLQTEFESSRSKAALLAAMLETQPFLFVLDGFEVMQWQESLKSGLIRSAELRDFLAYFARPGHPSFCLITTRVPLIDPDIANSTTYVERDVGGLSRQEGAALLKLHGVTSKQTKREDLTSEWDGHALTLVVLAALITSFYDGKVPHSEDLPRPSQDEPLYGRVHRVIKFYHDRLGHSERTFLAVFSVFRLAVSNRAFSPVFRKRVPGLSINNALVTLEDKALEDIVAYFLKVRILQYGTSKDEYTCHVLIRDFCHQVIESYDYAEQAALHGAVKDYYLGISADLVADSLGDLVPLMEVVHHACQAGAYDEAYSVYRLRVDKATRNSEGRVLTYQLGAYEKDLELMKEFFPHGEFSSLPLVTLPTDQGYILNEVGLCYMTLGALRRSIDYFDRSVALDLKSDDLEAAAKTLQNIAEVFIHVGELHESKNYSERSLDLAQKGDAQWRMWRGFGYRGWAEHLLGEIESASASFVEAERMYQEDTGSNDPVPDIWGMWHAEHLIRKERISEAERIAYSGLENARAQKYAELISQFQRLWGVLYTLRGDHAQAQKAFQDALKVARRISHRQVLLEALIGNGYWIGRYGDHPESSIPLLTEALGLAEQGDYKIFIVDGRVARAWGHARREGYTLAERDLSVARCLSKQLGYSWGVKDSGTLIDFLREAGFDPQVDG